MRTDADATAATAIASGGTSRDKVILVPASTVTTKTKTTTTTGKKGDKRRKSSSSGYLLSNAQHQHRQILGLGPELPEAGTGKFHHEKTKCICDTRDCVSNEMALEPTICSTHGMCYTQFLERGDGSTSITKGCIRYDAGLKFGMHGKIPRNLYARILPLNKSILAARRHYSAKTGSLRPVSFGINAGHIWCVAKATFAMQAISQRQRGSPQPRQRSSPKAVAVASCHPISV